MRTLMILLLLAAPAAAAWDLNNLTPSQRASIITMRNRWNNGYRGRSPQKNCGLKSYYYVNPKVRTSSPRAPGYTPLYRGAS